MSYLKEATCGYLSNMELKLFLSLFLYSTWFSLIELLFLKIKVKKSKPVSSGVIYNLTNFVIMLLNTGIFTNLVCIHLIFYLFNHI